MQTRNTDFVYKNEPNKLVFCMIWLIENRKIRTHSDKVLRDKAFKIASYPKHDGYQRGLASMVYNFFDKKSSGSGVANESNYQLTSELHKQIIQKFKRKEVHSSFEDNI